MATEYTPVANPAFSPVVRYGMLALTLATLVFLVVTDTLDGLYITNEVTQYGKYYDSVKVSEISVFNAVKKLWDRGGYGLALLVLIFSVLWPYLKFIGLIMAWTLPSRFLSSAAREKMMMILDIFGKWSLIDIWISMLISVPVSTTIDLKYGVSSSTGFEYLWPFFGFVGVTCTAHLITHTMLYLQRSVSYAPPSKESSSSALDYDEKILCCLKVKRSKKSQICVFLSIVTTVVVLSFAIVTEVYYYKHSNPVNFALQNWIYEKTESLIEIGTDFNEKAHLDQESQFDALSFFYFLMGFAGPYGAMLFLLILFFVPMTSSGKRLVYVAAEIAVAWGSLEVILVALLGSARQVAEIASNLKTQDPCTECTPVIETSLESGIILIIIAALLNVLVSYSLLSLAHHGVYGDMVVGTAKSSRVQDEEAPEKDSIVVEESDAP